MRKGIANDCGDSSAGGLCVGAHSGVDVHLVGHLHDP